MPITVALVEDNKEIREGLTVLINGSEGFHCVAAYPTAEDALKKIENDDPDIVMMDIQLPGMSGIECVRQLKAKHPKLQIMMQTIYEDDERIFDSLLAGASGYILKKTPPAKFLEAIQDLHNGGSPMSSQIARLWKRCGYCRCIHRPCQRTVRPQWKSQVGIRSRMERQ